MSLQGLESEKLSRQLLLHHTWGSITLRNVHAFQLLALRGFAGKCPEELERGHMVLPDLMDVDEVEDPAHWIADREVADHELVAQVEVTVRCKHTISLAFSL